MLPTSRSQIDKLGERLRHSELIALDDLKLLQAVIRSHAPALADVERTIRTGLRRVVTPRLKTSDTIVEKIRRERGRLSTIHDIAGCRLAPVSDLSEQDQVVAEIQTLFGADATRIVDRRSAPSHGYRGVHVIVSIGAVFVEVQVRTVGQDRWAQIMESLGDRWGRAVRYGGPPDDPQIVVVGKDRVGFDVTRAVVVETMQELSARIAEVEEAASRLDAIHESEHWLGGDWYLSDLEPDQEAYLSELAVAEYDQAVREDRVARILSVLAELADTS